MTRIKICGLCHGEDARAAAAYGADALGFIGVPGGPRFLSPEAFREVSTAVPPFVARVIVVNRPEDAAGYPAGYVQHYADTAGPVPSHDTAPSRIRAFRVRDEHSLRELAAYPGPVAAVLLDAYHPNTLGGAGQTFNWDLAVQAGALTDRPIILAGGLTPDNVQDALQAVRPYAVDVASGVESRPGVKDHAKLKAFVRAVREWDMRRG